MATIAIYCPCKVKEIGKAIITGDKVYFYWSMIYTNNPKAKCKYCGSQLKIQFI